MRSVGETMQFCSWPWKRLRGSLHEDEGSVALESALVLVAVLTLVFGLVEFCVLAYTLTVLSGAAKQGVRYAMSHGTDSNTCSGPSSGCTDSTGSNVASAVNAYLGNYLRTTTGISVQVSYPDNSSSPSSRVMVSVNYAYQPMFNFPGMSHTFSLTSESRILY
jgi:Flp pilus assembly protein TadG